MPLMRSAQLDPRDALSEEASSTRRQLEAHEDERPVPPVKRHHLPHRLSQHARLRGDNAGAMSSRDEETDCHSREHQDRRTLSGNECRKRRQGDCSRRRGLPDVEAHPPDPPTDRKTDEDSAGPAPKKSKSGFLCR